MEGSIQRKKSLCICVVGTASFCYAAKTLIRALGSQHTLGEYDTTIIWGTCDSTEDLENGRNELEEELFGLISQNMPEVKVRFSRVKSPPKVHNVKGYSNEHNLYLKELHESVFQMAKQESPDYCWSVEADVIPPPNALRTLVGCLDFDGGYYGVAMSTYCSQSGTSAMGGHGSPKRHIYPSYYIDERKLPEKFKRVFDKVEKKAENSIKYSLIKSRLEKESESLPPKGNCFYLNANKWRPRGWLDAAYPGIGKGAILPTDWTGLGCVLMNKEALFEINYKSYNGGGTGDLHLNWKCWEPAGIKRCVTTHAPCSHVVRKMDDDGKQNFDDLLLVEMYHQEDGEMKGHLRTRSIPFHKELNFTQDK